MKIDLQPLPSDLDLLELQSVIERLRIDIYTAFRLPPELLQIDRETRNVAADVAQPGSDQPPAPSFSSSTSNTVLLYR